MTRLATSKYSARAVFQDGRRFASKAEARRARELELLERAGEITGLAYQPRFPLTVNGQKVCIYVADFSYTETRSGQRVVEDVKGVQTPVYKLKKRLLRACEHIEILEVGA